MSARTKPDAQMVALSEVVGQLGGSPELVLARLELGGHPAPSEDWKGDPVVPANVAAQLLADWRVEQDAAEQIQRDYEVYVAEHEERRRAVGTEAFKKAQRAAHEAELRTNDVNFAAFVGQVPADNAHTRSAGREAQREALLEFDAKNKVKSFEQWKG